MSYHTRAELDNLGMQTGEMVAVSADARVFGAERISVGQNVRIDAFCVLSAGESGTIKLGNHIHISSGARLYGQGGIVLEDFSSVAAGSTLYSASDDYSGDWLMGPHIPSAFTNVTAREIRLKKYSAVAAHAVVLPGVQFGEGAVLGAMSMADEDLDPWRIYGGVPARSLRDRSRGLVDLATEFLASRTGTP